MKKQDLFKAAKSLLNSGRVDFFSEDSRSTIYSTFKIWQSGSKAFNDSASQEEIRIYSDLVDNYDDAIHFAIVNMTMDQGIDNELDYLELIERCNFSSISYDQLVAKIDENKRLLNLNDIFSENSVVIDAKIVIDEWDYIYLIWSDSKHFTAFTWWTLA